MQNYTNPQDGQGSLPAPDPGVVPSVDPVVPPADLSSPLVPGQQQPSLQRSADSPAVADDVDLIEKEWVLKAKSIVARTKDDPSAQSKDMNRFKADYLKTRYNKDIKVNEA